jgi:hypothetical protein
MSTDTLIGCWKAIDADSTGRGLIDTGEFGRFMKKGKPEKGPSWQERNMEASKAARHAVDADKDDRFHRDVARRLESVAVATDEEVVAASKVLNDAMGAALRDIDPAARSFIKLFNKMVRKPLQPLTSRYHPVTTPYHPLPPLTTRSRCSASSSTWRWRRRRRRRRRWARRWARRWVRRGRRQGLRSCGLSSSPRRSAARRWSSRHVPWLGSGLGLGLGSGLGLGLG